VGAVLAETQRLIRQLERRVEELERRPIASAGVQVPQAAPSAASGYVHSAASVSETRVAQPAVAPALSLAAIERSVHVVVDPAIDGARRRRRLAVIVTLFFLLVFGGLFAMLAQSYAPHQ
jgi:hypothetical protein